MSKPLVGHKIIHLERVDSTNNYTAKVFKSGDIHSGTVIMADIQTNGRGQRNNNWQSAQFENITMSFPLVLSQLKNTPIITLNYAIGLALKEFLSYYTNNISLKWPNDVMVNDKKIAGILIESFYTGGHLKSSIIGIGVNINQSNIVIPNSTSLGIETDKKYQPKLLVFELIKTLNKQLEQLALGNFSTLKSQFDAILWKKDIQRKFKNLITDEKFDGIIKSTDINGDIIIEINGSEEKFKNGTIDYLRK